MIKILLSLCLLIFVGLNCAAQKKPSKPAEKKSSAPVVEGMGDSGPDDRGSPKADPTKKHYLGCWAPGAAFKSDGSTKPAYFYITDETIATSESPDPIPYEEIDEGVNKVYYVLRLKSPDKHGNLPQHLYLLMGLYKEIVVYGLDEFETEGKVKETAKAVWAIKQADCGPSRGGAVKPPVN